MSVELLTAIGALLVGIGSFIGSLFASSRKLAVIEAEMKEIKSRLDEHNGYAEKFAETARSIATMETAIEVIKTKLVYIAKEA